MWTLKESSSDRGSGERSITVAETCNRLSQYLKEKGSLGGLQLARKLEPKGYQTSDFTSQAKTLYENMKYSAERRTEHCLMELFPHHAGVNCPKTGEDVTYNAMDSDHAIMENETAPMTIFYGGEIFVFDNFTADKVNDLMVLAMRDKCSSKPGLPLTRKTSFYRFMERRKVRALARAPYQVNGGPTASSTKHEEELILKL